MQCKFCGHESRKLLCSLCEDPDFAVKMFDARIEWAGEQVHIFELQLKGARSEVKRFEKRRDFYRKMTEEV